MINEQVARETAALGSRFREHLADFHDALDVIKAQYVAEWMNAQTLDERENLWRAARVCTKMKEHFGSIVSDGQVATHKLTELKRLK